jgi:cytochrome P450
VPWLVWATRLLEFQFADIGNDPELRKEVDVIAPALRNQIDALISARKAAGPAQDDVLGRCIAMQAADPLRFTDVQIRTALLGFIFGGPPQPPMGLPQTLEQLLRRPDALNGAQQAARAGDDNLLAGFVFEAIRFDPVAPFLMRVARKDAVIAAGTPRAVTVPKDGTVLAALGSAMMDERRVPDPTQFPRDLRLRAAASAADGAAGGITHGTGRGVTGAAESGAQAGIAAPGNRAGDDRHR